MGHLFFNLCFIAEEAEAQGNSVSCQSPTATYTPALPVTTMVLQAYSQPQAPSNLPFSSLATKSS